MPPPVVDLHDDYSDHHNGYRRSPVHSREGSIHPVYQHPMEYTDLHGHPHAHLSPRANYLGLPGPPLHPSQYSYRERSAPPFKSYMSSPAIGDAYSQSPLGSNCSFPQSLGANSMSSQSPPAIHPSLPGPARGNVRPSQLPLAGNHKAPDPARDDKGISTPAPTLPLAASASFPQSTGVSKRLPEKSVLPATADLSVSESTGASTPLDPIPLNPT